MELGNFVPLDAAQVVDRVFTRSIEAVNLPWRCVSVLLLATLLSDLTEAKATKVSQSSSLSSASHEESSGLTISPEEVQSLQRSGIGFVLINAEESSEKGRIGAGEIKRIYYTRTPSFRSAQSLAQKDRRDFQAGSLAQSRYLSGTPLDWRSLSLPFGTDPVPSEPIEVSPRTLSEAIKDGVDLQVIDLRPVLPGVSPIALSSVPNTQRLLPHEVDSESAELSKLRWIVLIDDGDRIAKPLAERLFRRGYSLVTILQGGFPAWIRATDK